jgi:hypothetical protein
VVNLTTWPANVFDLPLQTNVMLLTNSIYVYNTHSFTPANVNTVSNYQDAGTPPMPQFGLLITNRVQVFMLDGTHIIDYVQFGGPINNTNLNAIIADNPYATGDPNAGLWNTNLLGDTPQGVINQILYSENPQQNGVGVHLTSNDNPTWNNVQGGATVGQQVAFFNAFFSANGIAHYKDPSSGVTYYATNTENYVQVPFTPSVSAYGWTSWQANDPLVHYLASDLNFTGTEKGGLQTGWHQWQNVSALPTNNLGQVNDRYQPWGTSGQTITGVDANSYNMAYRDPLVRMSGNWDFPTNKFPTVGWLGRVHRGTPWQTVFLKATNILALVQNGLPSSPVGSTTWKYWTGNFNPYDATNTAPAQDRLLFDLFTTSFNDNATRGTLSVNQPGLAAWSALFSGVVALTNNLNDKTSRAILLPQTEYPPPGYGLITNQPAGINTVSSPLAQLVSGIDNARANFVNADGTVGSFEHIGDILGVPQLSQQSPFLNWNDALQQQNGISDEMYEWLPQQVMSLLRDSPSPRYVIYCYGQALKPAPNGVYLASTPTINGQSPFGMFTNYQVVAETDTRAVVQYNGTLTDVFTNSGNGWYSVPVLTNNNAVVQQFNILPPD